MKITIVMGAFFPVPPILGGAVEKVWFALAQEFVRQGHDVLQISRAHPDLPDCETIAGVRHQRIRGFAQPRSIVRLKLCDFIYSLGARRILPPADILVTNTFWLPALARGARFGKLYVHVARLPRGQMRFYRHADRLQGPSSAVADAIKLEAPALAARTRVIPNPIPQSSFAPRPVSSRERIVLFVGRVHPEKGVHVLIEAFTQAMDSELKNWRLVVIGPTAIAQGGGGDGYLSRLRQLAGKTTRVDFRGPIFDSEKLAQEMQNARLFVYPSLAEKGETFGLAPLEAMAAGCAVVVSDLACFRDFICDGKTGFVFDHRGSASANVLRQALVTAAQDEEALDRVAAAGWQKSAEYSVANVAGRFLEDFSHLREKQPNE